MSRTILRTDWKDYYGPAQLMGKMLANLKQVLPKEIFTNWFEGNIIPYSYSEEENLLILDTMTNFLRDYVSKNIRTSWRRSPKTPSAARRGSS